MKRTGRAQVSAVVVLMGVGLVGCSNHLDSDDAGMAVADAGELHDSGVFDAGVADAGSTDAGTADSGSDAGQVDAGSDAGATDSGIEVDAGTDAGCPTGYGECDSNASTVCETSLTLITSCGGCTTVCSAAHGTPGCSPSGCVVSSCDSNYGDCDGLVATGCETSLLGNAHHCGACGNDCSAWGSTCMGSTCMPIKIASGQPFGSDNGENGNWAFGNDTIIEGTLHGYRVSRYSTQGDHTIYDGGTSLWLTTGNAIGHESIVVQGTDVLWAQKGTPSVVVKKAFNASPSTAPQPVFTPEYLPTYVRQQGAAYYWCSGDYQSGDPGGYVYTRAVNAASSDPGTRIVTESQGTHGAIRDFITTSDALYWVSSGKSDALRSVPLSGGTPTDVVPGPLVNGYGQLRLRAQGSTVFYTRNVDTSFLNGIYRWAPGDTSPTQVISAEDVLDFDLSGSWVYYLRGGSIYRTPAVGGSAGELVVAQNAQQIVGQDADFLYVALSTCCQTDLYKVKKPPQ